MLSECLRSVPPKNFKASKKLDLWKYCSFIGKITMLEWYQKAHKEWVNLCLPSTIYTKCHFSWEDEIQPFRWGM